MNTATVADAKEIKSLIRNAEALGDEFIAALAALKIKMLNSRAHPHVVPHEGQAALAKLAHAERQALASSSSLFRVHNELSDIAIRMDMEHPTPPAALTGIPEFDDDTLMA